MKSRTLLLALLSLVLLVACDPNAHRVEKGVIRDTLFSVEETKNGYWRVWMTHDDIAGYCTNDPELGKLALNILKEHDGEVLVYFRDIRPDDPEASWWSRSDCGTVYSGGGSTYMFMFDDISPVAGR